MWVFLGLHLPLSLVFWHAPALVYWHDMPPIKGMFFSIIACLRNFWAFTVFAALLDGGLGAHGTVAHHAFSAAGQPQPGRYIVVPGVAVGGINVLYITVLHLSRQF